MFTQFRKGKTSARYMTRPFTPSFSAKTSTSPGRTLHPPLALSSFTNSTEKFGRRVGKVPSRGVPYFDKELRIVSHTSQEWWRQIKRRTYVNNVSTNKLESCVFWRLTGRLVPIILQKPSLALCLCSRFRKWKGERWLTVFFQAPRWLYRRGPILSSSSALTPVSWP